MRYFCAGCNLLRPPSYWRKHPCYGRMLNHAHGFKHRLVSEGRLNVLYAPLGKTAADVHDGETFCPVATPTATLLQRSDFSDFREFFEAETDRLESTDREYRYEFGMEEL